MDLQSQIKVVEKLGGDTTALLELQEREYETRSEEIRQRRIAIIAQMREAGIIA